MPPIMAKKASSQPGETPLTTLSPSLRNAGELSVTIRNSIRHSSWIIMWVATGEDFTITLASASWRMASWSLNGYFVNIKKSHCHRHLLYPKTTVSWSCNALSDMWVIPSQRYAGIESIADISHNDPSQAQVA